MVYTNLRDWLKRLEDDGDLKHISKEVDLRHELAAVAKSANGQCALCFENPVSDYLPNRNPAIPVVTGVTTNRDMMARAFGLKSKEQLAEYYYHAQTNPIEPVVIDKDQAPCKEVIMTGEDVDLGILPVPVHHALDSGAFIDAGILVAANPKTGKRNVSVHRMEMRDRNHLGICIWPKHLNKLFTAAEEENKPLEAAVCIGVDPILMAASQAKIPFDCEEYGVAGGLYGKPLELVQCETIDLAVPAQAEIVIEGKILPKVREMEGPFGEFPRTYGWAAESPVFEVTAITMRNNPLYVTIVPASNDHTLVGAIANEGLVLNAVRASVPTAKNVVMQPGSANRYCAVIQIKKTKRGEAKNVICAALGCNFVLKKVIVVDEDVNPYSYEDIEWATTLRVQPDRDILIIPGIMGNNPDPSTDKGFGAKIGIDATVPFGTDPKRNLRVSIPNEERIHYKDYVD